MPASTFRARQLRKASTDAELYLWKYLRAHRFQGHKFRRQHPIGPFIVDFVCITSRLVIELDGSQHIENARYDRARDLRLNRYGYRVLRFWNNAVFKETAAVLEEIERNL